MAFCTTSLNEITYESINESDVYKFRDSYIKELNFRGAWYKQKSETDDFIFPLKHMTQIMNNTQHLIQTSTSASSKHTNPTQNPHILVQSTLHSPHHISHGRDHGAQHYPQCPETFFANHVKPRQAFKK